MDKKRLRGFRARQKTSLTNKESHNRTENTYKKRPNHTHSSLNQEKGRGKNITPKKARSARDGKEKVNLLRINLCGQGLRRANTMQKDSRRTQIPRCQKGVNRRTAIKENRLKSITKRDRKRGEGIPTRPALEAHRTT